MRKPKASSIFGTKIKVPYEIILDSILLLTNLKVAAKEVI
jgi:hypothetical protein